MIASQRRGLTRVAIVLLVPWVLYRGWQVFDPAHLLWLYRNEPAGCCMQNDFAEWELKHDYSSRLEWPSL